MNLAHVTLGEEVEIELPEGPNKGKRRVAKVVAIDNHIVTLTVFVCPDDQVGNGLFAMLQTEIEAIPSEMPTEPNHE